jgi:hypothetical protein
MSCGSGAHYLLGKADGVNDLSPQIIFKRALHYWWILSITIIVGCIAGWIFSQFHHPIYEATSYYQVNLDEHGLIERLGLDSKTQLDFATKNIYLAPVEIVFYTPDTREKLIAILKSEGISLLPSDFNATNFILDRHGSPWFITVRDTNPDKAVKMANAWLGTVDAELREYGTHALKMQDLKLLQSIIQSCFVQSSFNQANQCAGTNFSSLSEMQTYLDKLAGQIATEAESSQGTDPLLTFIIERPAVASNAPMLYVQSDLMVAGAVIGLLIGVAFLFVGKGPCFIRM